MLSSDKLDTSFLLNTILARFFGVLQFAYNNPENTSPRQSSETLLEEINCALKYIHELQI